MPAPLAAIKAPPFTKEQAMEFAQVISKDPQKSRQLEAEWSTLFEKRYGTVLGKAAP